MPAKLGLVLNRTYSRAWTLCRLRKTIRAVRLPRMCLLVLLLLLLHGLAREVDHALGLVLRAEVEPAGLLAEVTRAMGAEGPAWAGRVLAWVFGGVGVWLGLSWWRSRQERTPLAAALSREVPTLAPLLLRPALTVAALVSVALRPSYPWAFTLPVALTQDLGVAQDAAALGALLAIRLPPIRFPAPSPRAVFFVSFLLYALLTPEWARHWDGHPGNEPKYLRMAVALGHDLTLDAEGVSAAMEELPTTPLGEGLVYSGRFLARESWRMAVAVVRGDAGRDAIRATRIIRQTVRGKEGGVFYVLAPGPSLVLAPAFRIDRALNRSRGVVGPIVVGVLIWNAIAALLVVSVFVLIRDATARPGLAATLAFGFAVLPPFVFYFFQFYPEMPGALVLALAFHALALRPERLRRHPWLFGVLLATLPWLHQKFLPVWLILVATAVWVVIRTGMGRPWAPTAGTRTVIPRASSGARPEESAVSGPGDSVQGRGTPGDESDDDASSAKVDSSRDGLAWRARNDRWRWLLAFLLPQGATLYLTALYNFAITGSVRPDALFLAWGPGGVTTVRMGQGLLGILLDARYGILPYVPLLVLAVAGLVVSGARIFAVVLPAAAAYYLTVASADNWAGAVSNLGRYFMPVAPLAVALVAVALIRVPRRRGALALALILAGWSALFALALWRDPLAANDSALLLAKSTYADGNQYIPNLHLKEWADAAPGMWARVALWLVAIGVTAAWWLRVAKTRKREGAREARGRVETREHLEEEVSERPDLAREDRTPGARPTAALAGAFVVLLAFAFALEQWPARRSSPSFGNALRLGPRALVFAERAALVREDEVVVGPGAATLLVRAPEALSVLPLTVGGEGVMRAEGLRPIVLRATGGRVDLPLRRYHVVLGAEGRRAVFSGAALTVEGRAILRPADSGIAE
jgi:hypothetical protein